MKNLILVNEALHNLMPNRGYTIEDDDFSSLRVVYGQPIADGEFNYVGPTDENYPGPTETEFETEYQRVLTEYNNKQYQRDRAAAYPSIEDQLDMLYHDKVDGTDTWRDAITAVKNSNPKP